MKKSYQKITLTLVLIFSILLAFLLPGAKPNIDSSDNQKNYNAVVISADEKELTLEIKNKDLNGKEVIVGADEGYGQIRRIYEKGDKVVVIHDLEFDKFYISDFLRTDALIWLAVIFLILVVFISGWQGIGALIGMFLSFVVLFKLVLPQILAGTSPVMAAILGSILIIPATFYSSHGFNKKTTVAVAGTLITLIISGLLATVFADVAGLTGLASEEISFLSTQAAAKIDFRGLVLAGMIISMLGILDDITVSQASIVQQLKSAKKNIKFSELYFRSMAVGRDHISSLVNTLILVYAGASLPLLLLFLDIAHPITEIINLEFIAEEIVRTLIGSIGLILAVPITSFLAAFVTDNSKSEDHFHSH